ncbi:DNA topoisomerase III [Algibacillus agarilyticus]|uniref:DNA topoisomerase III n=1 Tax=Algibacillus agarilyticus TaxID=2234133 RepID=UPI000DCFFE3B|nr:DNA topoisomerase III [Algibacillus agarilyticus]
MKLYIAEKPSLGRAIAAALPKPHKNQNGYIEAGNGDVVSWCIGHILEQAQPEEYNPDFKKWQFAHLPIVPDQWQLKPKTQTKAQLSVLRKLVKQASQLVHAGDPDREGQLLIDEVIDYLKVSKTKKQQTQRLLISDLNLPAVKRALNNLKTNQEFMPLSVSALARSRADWLYGINLTRAYTLQGQKTGYRGVLSVGRVQTPLLGLVVRRDQEIAEFVPKNYYDVHAHLQTADNKQFIAKWIPSEACQPYMDEHDRVLNKALAQNVVKRITGQPAQVESVDKQDKKLFAPLPYNLSALQIDAAKQFAMNAKQVLDVCQSLYEKHKLITYPRSDCRYLPKEHHAQAPSIINMLGQSSGKWREWANNANASLKSKAWNDSKVSAHHAIIPTAKNVENVQLNRDEQQIYQLITRQYLAQFYPPYLYQQTKVMIVIAGGHFAVNAKTPQQIGWKALFARTSSTKAANKTPNNDNEDVSDSLQDQTLPPLSVGEALQCTQGELLEKITQPPKTYTDASLLSAMTGIARFVADPSIKRILKETDGLGTEATRAGIIELLFKRGFLVRNGKSITATDVGKSLINALPEQATYPDMTAQWESNLNGISEKKFSYQHFMQPLTQVIAQMIEQSVEQNFAALPKTPPGKAKPFKKPYKKRTKKKTAN